MSQPSILDAYRYARRTREGCQHQMGCKCDAPMWLRLPTPPEEARWFVPPGKVGES